MENDGSTSSSREKRSNESSKSSKKDRKPKSSMASSKSKKKTIKPRSPNQTHSNATVVDNTPVETALTESGDQSGNRSVSRVLGDGEALEDVEGASRREESPSKRGRSKSRSRSGSRSRFSSFFRRKKRSMSETDLNKTSNGDGDKQYDSAENVNIGNRPNTLQFRQDVESGRSTRQLRSNLKRTSPHHFYDSRIQPRDRLLHMTVADAAKEQKLRRANSAQRNSHGRDVTTPTPTVMFLSSPSLAATLGDGDSARQARADSIPSSTLSSIKKKQHTEAELRAFEKGFSFPDITNDRSERADGTTIVKVIRSSYPDDSSIGQNRLSQDLRRSVDLMNVDVDLQSRQHKSNVDSHITDEHKDSQIDIDEEDTQTLVNVSQDDNLHSIGRRSPSPTPRHPPVEDVIDARIKRQASLSKFLELRQTLPSSLSRAHRLSQSSDSGVTSRDTSPSASMVHSDTKQRPLDRHSPPREHKRKEKPPNPYVVSSVSISPTLITAPSVSLKEPKLNSNDVPTLTVGDRPTFIKLDDSMGESSSMSSSPQINSMTSSFRSSDQGYVESESDDDASFATPPEEVEAMNSERRERLSRTFYPGVLEKLLLETSREQNQRGLFPEHDLDAWDTKRRHFLSKAEENGDDSQLPRRRFRDRGNADGEPRYIPRGVRRSKSDLDSRYKSPRRFYRHSPLSDGSSQHTGSAEAFSTSPNLAREKVKFDLDRLSATSTTTLTNQDESGTSHADDVTSERMEQKLVPVMGTVAQQKYRRTYSPSRVRKVIPKVVEEKSTLPVPDVSTSTSKVLEETAQSSARTSSQLHSTHNLPEKPSSVSIRKKELSPTVPKKGILKSPVKNRTLLSEDTSSQTKQKAETSREGTPKIEISRDVTPKIEISKEATPKIEVSREATPKIEVSREATPQEEMSREDTPKTEITREATPKTEIIKGTVPEIEIHIEPTSKLKVSKEIMPKREPILASSPKIEIFHDAPTGETFPSNLVSTKICDIGTSATAMLPAAKAHSAIDMDANSKQVMSQQKSDVPKGTDAKLPMDFPLIHGLEVGMHKVHTFGGYSLTDYLKEQSKGNWKRQSVRGVTKSKETKPSKTSLKKKGSTNEEHGRPSNEFKLDSKESNQEATKSSLAAEYTLKPADDGKFKIMVDKECQTSAWLINTLTRKKTSKLKKKTGSFSKKKKPQRRGSSVSDTFIPTDLKRHKESLQRSSLGDIRKACSTEPDFAKKGERCLPLPSRIGRGLSEKNLPKRLKSRRPGIIMTQEPLLAGSSRKPNWDANSDDSSQLPKPKKLSLTAVILLKNRLAKYREKKRNERASISTVEDEPVLSRVPSDTLITIENEMNLSKLEISKETDIIDDDIYEPEFSLGYPRKQLRFESLPCEPMQSEEPLPPLPTSRRMRQRRESTLRERKRKCVQYCKKFIAFLFSHIGLCSLVVAYTILGGFIFQALEDQAEYTVRSTIRERREKVVGQLVSLAVEFQKTERGMENFTGEVNDTILNYQEFIHGITKDKGWDGVEGVDEEGVWTFASSLLYAITVTTTIGYGHVAPKTPEGRIVTIGYAVVGIPLTLLCLTNIGDVMATGFRLLYGKICCGVCCTMFKPRRRRIQVDLEKGLGGPIVTTEEEQPDKPKEVIHVPTSLCLLLIAGYIFAGAMLFSMWESWDILTGSYFCFITLSTIGFGDIVPGMDSNAWAAEEKLVLCALYLVLGLSLIAMCFNLVQEDVKAKCRWLGMKLGIVEKHETPI